MLGHGAKLGQKIDEAIAALLSHRSIEEAAHEIGVGVNTLSRWMKQPEFETALREARRRVSERAIGRLQDAVDAAAKTVLKIMLDSNVPPGTRLRAAEVVLERAIGAGEIENFEDRLAKLARMAGFADPSRRCSNVAFVRSLPGPDLAMAQMEGPPEDAVEAEENVVEGRHAAI